MVNHWCDSPLTSGSSWELFIDFNGIKAKYGGYGNFLLILMGYEAKYGGRPEHEPETQSQAGVHQSARGGPAPTGATLPFQGRLDPALGGRRRPGWRAELTASSQTRCTKKYAFL